MKPGYYAAKLNAEYEFEGGEITTVAFRDSGGVPTGPGGVLVKSNGERVQMGDTWTEEEALALYAQRFEQYGNKVLELVDPKISLNQFQFDALVVLIWNIGFKNFRNSTVLTCVNEGRFEEAAAAFLLWKRDTLYGGTTGPDGEPARDPNGHEMAEGTKWFKAFRGIYRRSAAAGLLFLGLDWSKATKSEQIKMSKTPLTVDYGWYDRIDFETPWTTILDDARGYRLPEPPVLESDPLNGGQLKKLEDFADEHGIEVVRETKAAATEAPAKVEVAEPAAPPADAPKLNTALPPKKVEKSKTGKDVVAKARGRDVGIISTITGGSVVTAATNAEKVGGVIEKLTPQTWLIMLGALAAAGMIYGGLQWWWARNSLHERRQREQEPKY